MLLAMICIDDIVFNQQQLDNAVKKGCKNICICDNSFNLPSADEMSYMAIGSVRAVIRLDRDKRYSINFEGFQPEIIFTGGYTGITEQQPNCVSFGCGSYANNNVESANSYTVLHKTSHKMSYMSSSRFCGKYNVGDDVFYANGYGLNLI